MRREEALEVGVLSQPQTSSSTGTLGLLWAILWAPGPLTYSFERHVARGAWRRGRGVRLATRLSPPMSERPSVWAAIQSVCDCDEKALTYGEAFSARRRRLTPRRLQK